MELIVACFSAEWMSAIAEGIMAVTAVIALIFALREIDINKSLKDNIEKKKDIRKLITKVGRYESANEIYEIQKGNKPPIVKSMQELESLLDDMENEQSIGIAFSPDGKKHYGIKINLDW